MTDETQHEARPPDPAGPASRPAPAVRRPLVERIGLAAIAAFLVATFAGIAAICFASGEPFLGMMAAVGALMTAWVGALSVVRG